MTPRASSNLRDETTFPPFSELFNEYDTPREYYRTTDRVHYEPHRHWCFMGEIRDLNTILRLRITVRDIEGKETLVNFNTEDRGASILGACKKGYTVVILYPKQRWFMDGGSGFRIEEMRFVKILPYSLATLFAANDVIFSKDLAITCAACGDNATPGNALLRCSRCQTVHYCGKECQVTSWDEGHKSQCRVFKALSWFTEKDWERFDGWLTF